MMKLLATLLIPLLLPLVLGSVAHAEMRLEGRRLPVVCSKTLGKNSNPHLAMVCLEAETSAGGSLQYVSLLDHSGTTTLFAVENQEQVPVSMHNRNTLTKLSVRLDRVIHPDGSASIPGATEQTIFMLQNDLSGEPASMRLYGRSSSAGAFDAHRFEVIFHTL